MAVAGTVPSVGGFREHLKPSRLRPRNRSRIGEENVRIIEIAAGSNSLSEPSAVTLRTLRIIVGSA